MPVITSSIPAKQLVVPGSVSARANDPCRYWKLWHHPEDIDSIIACLMWRDKHRLRAMDIAAALAFVQPAEYWGIEAEDIINVYSYLQKHQDLPGNPFADWQGMRDMRTHPHWRYYVIWATSCNIQRMQNMLDESLLPINKQAEMGKFRFTTKCSQHSSELSYTNNFRFLVFERQVYPRRNLKAVHPFEMASIHSIPPDKDICGKWPGLWSQGHLMDSLICCMMFPDRHYMDEDKIAYALGVSYQGCVGMKGQDVKELYGFLLANPTLHSNPIKYWQDISNRVVGDPDDRRLVELAIVRFGRRSRSRAR